MDTIGASTVGGKTATGLSHDLTGLRGDPRPEAKIGTSSRTWYNKDQWLDTIDTMDTLTA